MTIENNIDSNVVVVATGNPRNKYMYSNHWIHRLNDKGEKLSPPLGVLNLLFLYNPSTGNFKRKFSMQWGEITTREIETTDTNGYKVVKITDSEGNRVNYGIHRLCYVMYTGEDIPVGMQVDHKNGVRDDNRWENLRLVSHVVNGRNQKVKSNNTSGYSGVYWNKNEEKWKAQVMIGGKNKSVGSYDTPEEAHQARLEYIGRFNLQNLDECFSYRHTNGEDTDTL